MTEAEDKPAAAMTRSDAMRVGVYASVVAAVAMLYFIDPILRFLARGLVWIGGRAWSGALDSIYSSASLGHRNYLDVVFFGFLIVAPICVTTITSLVRALQSVGVPHRRDKGRRSGTRRHVFALALSLVLLVLATFLATTFFIDLQLNTSFEQRMTVLAPVLDQQAEEELRAEWASMRNRGDYLRTVEHIERTAREKGVTLPPLLL